MNLFRHLSLYAQSMLIAITVACVVVVLEVALLNSDTTALAGGVPSSESLTEPTNIENVTYPSLPSYRQLLTRPLFTDTRKPAPRAANKPTQTIDLGKKWKLTGVVFAGDNSHVFLQGIRDKSVRRLEVGATLDGWVLREITPEHVVLDSGGQEARLELREEADKP